MNHYYITGTSKGIGKAIAELLLQDPANIVTGISRGSSIKHKNYNHLSLDLTNPDFINSISFSASHYNKVVLINNAGILGEVGKAGEISSKSIIDTFNVNLIAPAILINKFISFYKETEAEKVIINISSGAGKKPIDGWGAYCSSKAAIDMFSEVVVLEQALVTYPKFSVFSIAPGIVDTNMQAEIRKSKSNSFSRVKEFKNYKKEHKLSSPEEVAKKIILILANTIHNKTTVFSVKDNL